MLKVPRLTVGPLLIAFIVVFERLVPAAVSIAAVVDQDCSRLRPNPSYVQNYARPGGSGMLDHGTIMAVASAAQHHVERILDDQQIRIEQVRCDVANSKARLNDLISRITQPTLPNKLNPKRHSDLSVTAQSKGPAAVRHPAGAAVSQSEFDCSSTQPNPPYSIANPGNLWYSDGSLDHGRVLNWVILLDRNQTRQLDDFQVRINRVRCEQLNIEQKVAVYSSHVVLRQTAAPGDKLGCVRGPAQPSYVTRGYSVANPPFNSKGIADHGKILNTLRVFQYRIEKSLDDLQTRIEEVYCQQTKIMAKLKAIASVGDKFKQVGAGAAPRLSVPQNQGKEGPAVHDPMRAISPGVSVTPQPRPTHTDRDCRRGQAATSYVEPLPEWAGGDDVYHPEIIKVINEIRNAKAQVFDDLRLRLDRVLCEQGNIQGRLIALTSNH